MNKVLERPISAFHKESKEWDDDALHIVEEEGFDVKRQIHYVRFNGW